MGLSSPYAWMSRSRTSRSAAVVASGLLMSTGSPGARCIRKNEMSGMPSRSGSARTSRRNAYGNMARYSSVSGRYLHLPRRITLQGLGNVPLVEVVADAVRRRHDAPNPRRDHRQGVSEEQEDDRLVLRQNFLKPVVVLLPLRLDAGNAPLLQHLVGLRVRVADAVQVVRAGLRRVPDFELVGVLPDAPAQDDGFESPLLDVLLQERRPLDHLDVDLDTEVLQGRLHDLGDFAPLVVALVGPQHELDRLAVLDEDALGVLGAPSGSREKLARLRHIVWIRAHVRVVGPGPRLVGTGRLATEPEPHALDQLALVDGVGERLAHPLVGESGVAEVEPEVGIDIVLVLVLVVGLAERREVGLTLELQRREAGRAGRVDTPRLQLEEDGRLARDDAIDDAREVRTPLEIILIRDENDLLAGLPLLEAVCPRPDRIGPVLRRLPQATFLHVRL